MKYFFVPLCINVLFIMAKKKVDTDKKNIDNSEQSATINGEGSVTVDWKDISVQKAKPLSHGGFYAFPENDILNTFILKLKPLKGYYDVAMHGTPTMACFGTKDRNMTARELATMIKHRDDYKGGKVRLISCSTGAKPNDDDLCFAEELANALGEIVNAPTDVILFSSDGTFRVGMDGKGEMKDYHPNERRLIGKHVVHK